ncbi:hypothetical protein ACS0ME_005553, partial [Escherichia coli]
MKSRTIWTIILGALLVCCIAVAYTLTKSQAGASSSGESIATIGGKSVTREEWLKEMEDQYGKSTLEDMINVRVVEQLAKKNNLKISKSEVDR